MPLTGFSRLRLIIPPRNLPTLRPLPISTLLLSNINTMADECTTVTREASPDIQSSLSVTALATPAVAVQSTTAASDAVTFVSGPDGTFYWFKKLPLELREMIWKARLRSIDVLNVEFVPKPCDHAEAKGLLNDYQNEHVEELHSFDYSKLLIPSSHTESFQ